MIKLKSIRIKGFKEKEREVNLTFSDEPITVIYGENGCGKTTFLKVLHAIFKGDFKALTRENISEIELVYFSNKGKEELLKFVSKEKEKEKEKELYNRVYYNLLGEGDVFKKNYELDVQTLNTFKDLKETKSFLFGVHRGIVQNLNINKDVELAVYQIKGKLEKTHILSNRAYEELQILIDNLLSNDKLIKSKYSDSFWKEKHIVIDEITMFEITLIITKNYRKGQEAMSNKIRTAFLNTISNSIQIELATQKYELPKDFEQRIDAKRKSLVDFVKPLQDLPLQKELLNYFEKKETAANVKGSKIFRALLLNILEEVEKENITLKAITKLIEVFNSHLYKNKKLIVTGYEAYIQVNEKERHGLGELSSGERHLLTFLTTFLILARDYNFLLIDEPEISLNMKWQRELLPLLNELNPNSQIIVATHSPFIAHRNTNYLVELI